MAQTNLKSDAWDIYNQATKTFDWTLQNGQYNNTYAFGTVGVSAGSNAVRSDVVDVSSYLSGRDNILSKCNPPIPKIEEANLPPLSVQKKDVNTLVPLYTREKKSTSSATNKSYIPYSFNPGIRQDTQHVKNIVFTGWSQRGGALTLKMNGNKNLFCIKEETWYLLEWKNKILLFHKLLEVLSQKRLIVHNK